MDATMENKIGMPPPYQALPPNPAPPPSYGFSTGPVMEQPRTEVITSTPLNPGPVVLGPGPTGLQCPKCNKSIVTRVDYVPNNRTHIVSAGLCVIAGCCCGCFVPYCMKSCKTANHYCPKCTAYLGSADPS